MRDHGRFGPGGHEGGFGGWHMLHPLLGLLILCAVVALVVWLVLRSTSRSARQVPYAGPMVGPDPALTELRLRYARGEVSREEYIQTAADLGGGAPPPADLPPVS